MPSEAARDVPLRYPVLLGTFTLLFVLRVAGQALVGLGEGSFLPPFERWYSGLLPYWLLLPAQIALIVLMLKIVADFARRNGYFVRLKPRTGIILQVLAGIYALSMVMRYVLTTAPGAALVHRDHPDLVPFRAGGLHLHGRPLCAAA